MCVCRDGYMCLCAHVGWSYIWKSHECAIEKEMWGVEREIQGCMGMCFVEKGHL